VVSIERDALDQLSQSLEQSFVDACELISVVAGRVVVTGMGKSGHIGRKAAATLSATGTPAIYVHPAEAAHGDLGMITRSDLLIVISNSGNTSELRAILNYANDHAIPVIGIASRPDSLVMTKSTIRICTPTIREACAENIAPTSSTTLQLALCDALAMAVMDLRGFSRDGMKTFHPGGSIGLRLTPVGEIVHTGTRLPLVSETTPMREVIPLMTSMGFGIAGIVDFAGRLIGVITDGDLRRHFDEIGSSNARDVMTRSPKMLETTMLADDALKYLNDNMIAAAFVIDPAAEIRPVPVGIVHIHDFLRIGLG
jgi:arabinose-5-phosphate isomerase